MQQQELLKKLYHQSQNQTDLVASIQKETEKHPYFSINHFYLLKSLNKADKQFADTAAKTALYFNNNFWLNYQLNKKEIENTNLVTSENKPEAEKEELLFEPLFATDYFASQGIKLSEEVQASDKLGKQLKSFTEWLKTMKKVNIDKLPDVSEATQKAVEHMAEKSNKTEDVVTESMAEVLIQQGKNSKAIEIYEKLSLQIPSKSVFFADKIKNLKGK